MTTPISNITLKFPCQEKWDQLQVVAGGRLCQSCAHIVRDFRDCSKEELDNQLNTQSHVCGIFKREQLSAAFLKASAVTIATTSLGACQPELQPQPEKNIDIDKIGLFANPQTIEADTTANLIMGIVISEAHLPELTNGEVAH